MQSRTTSSPPRPGPDADPADANEEAVREPEPKAPADPVEPGKAPNDRPDETERRAPRGDDGDAARLPGNIAG